MTETTPVTDLLGSLDFDPALRCEHSEHRPKHDPPGPAAWVVSFRCVNCGIELEYLLCDVGKRRLESNRTYCHHCAWSEPDGEHLGLTFRPLNGA